MFYSKFAVWVSYNSSYSSLQFSLLSIRKLWKFTERWWGPVGVKSSLPRLWHIRCRCCSCSWWSSIQHPHNTTRKEQQRHLVPWLRCRHTVYYLHFCFWSHLTIFLRCLLHTKGLFLSSFACKFKVIALLLCRDNTSTWQVWHMCRLNSILISDWPLLVAFVEKSGSVNQRQSRTGHNFALLGQKISLQRSAITDLKSKIWET